MGRKQPAGHLLSNLGVEYNAHWTGLIKTSVQWLSGGRCWENHRGSYTNHKQILWYLPHKRLIHHYTMPAGLFEYQTKHKNDDQFLSYKLLNYKNSQTPKMSLPFCLQSFQLWSWSQKCHKSKPLAIHVTIVKQWIAPCTWDVWSIKMQFSRSLFLKTRESASHQFHRNESDLLSRVHSEIDEWKD